jgi:hypothetical protein
MGCCKGAGRVVTMPSSSSSLAALIGVGSKGCGEASDNGTSVCGVGTVDGVLQGCSEGGDDAIVVVVVVSGGSDWGGFERVQGGQ